MVFARQNGGYTFMLLYLADQERASDCSASLFGCNGGNPTAESVHSHLSYLLTHPKLNLQSHQALLTLSNLIFTSSILPPSSIIPTPAQISALSAQILENLLYLQFFYINILKVRVAEMMAEEQRPEKLIKIGVIGNVDAGKSTLVSVLTKGIADDGNGGARVRVLNYLHEQQSGRTSSIGQEIMGFSKDGRQIVPERFNQNKNKYWKEVVSQSYKIISLVDLCGHEKYLKTTINGLTGLTPDFGCVVIGANMGLQKMTKEHIGLCLFLKIPFFIILTKIDLAPENKYNETMEELKKLLKHKLLNKFPIEINEKTDEKEQLKIAELMPSGNICPIFSVSSVSKFGFDILTNFMWRIDSLKTITIEEAITQPFEFEINENFLVEGVGLVVSGVIKSGVVTFNKSCLLGPDKLKNFKNVVVKSIHVNRVARNQAYCGELACLCLKSTKANEKLVRKDIRRGMVVVDNQEKPEPVTTFQAEMQVLHNSTTIKPKYEGVLHCGTIQQTVVLDEIYGAEQLLRNDDRGLVKFSFKYRPEFVKEGETILLREGKTKIIGTITKILG